MEAKYIKDYRHNYMILTCGQKEYAESYSCKLLSGNKVKGILKCSVRYVNGTTCLYYDISSCVPLSQLYQNKRMTYEQVRDLLEQVHGILTELNTYFMEETRLVLMPEFLYYNLTDNKYLGTFYPEYEAADNPYEPLMDFLLNQIDTEDQQLADRVYQIYEMSEERFFSLEDAIHLLEKGKERVSEKAAEPFLEKNILPEDYGLAVEPTETAYELFSAEEGKTETERKVTEERKTAKIRFFYPVFMVLAVLGMAGAGAVLYLYELTEEMQLVIQSCMGVMGCCFLFGLVQTLRAARKKQMQQDKGADLQEEFFIKEDLPVSLENVIDANMNVEIARNDFPGYGKEKQESENRIAQNKFGNTVFFDRDELVEHKLYALDRKNKTHIHLTKFPYTIGKLAGYVDLVLPDDSVSRIHARFDKQDKAVLLTDLNSTNGTFKNGLRMQPQETVEIEPGDEIRFGNVNYCYR